MDGQTKIPVGMSMTQIRAALSHFEEDATPPERELLRLALEEVEVWERGIDLLAEENVEVRGRGRGNQKALEQITDSDTLEAARRIAWKALLYE